MTVAPRRALDVSMGVAAAYAGRLLADVGWDVVKVEPPEGDWLRRQPSRWGGAVGAAFEVINARKRSAVVAGENLEALVREADVVLGDFRPVALRALGVDEAAFERWTPRHAVVSVSPFGLTGPKSHWAASELTLQAASGMMFLTGEADQPPQQLPPYQAELTGGVAAAVVALASLRCKGPEPVRADVSIQEAMAPQAHRAVGAYVYYGEVTRREQRIKAGLRMVPASDGFVYCAPGAVGSMRMDGIAVLLDEPQLAEERFQTAEGRMQHWDEFVALFVPPFRTRTAQEWFEAAEAMHMTFALVQTIDDLFACPHLEDRGFLDQSQGRRGAIVQPLRAFGGSLPATAPAPAPETPGQHSMGVLAEWLER